MSGANLTLLLAFVLTAARWVGVRGWWLRLLGLVGVVVFVALCRTEPSVLRAAAMGLVALAALGSGGRRAGLRNLAVAMLLLLLLDPFLSRSVGFALSVLASGGIIWWARRWAAILNRWLPLIVAETVAVPLAAQLATLPVVAAISGQVSVSGLLANALAGPFVGPATVLGFAAAGSSLISSGAGRASAGWGAAGCAQVIIWVAHAGAALPGSSWPWPTDPARLVWLASAALVTALVMGFVLARRLAVPAAGRRHGRRPRSRHRGSRAGRRAAGCWWPARSARATGWRVRVADGAAVVVDAGPDPVAMRPLPGLSSEISDGAVADLDPLPRRPRRRPGRRARAPGGRSDLGQPARLAGPRGRQRCTTSAERRRIPVHHPAGRGRGTVVGATELEVLGPGRPSPGVAETESSAENDGSLVVMATVAGLRVLLTGDVEPPGQAAILAAGRICAPTC